jgi:hypothetical protein
MASPRSSVAPRLGRGRGLLCRRLALPAACPAGAAARPAGVAGGSSPGGCGRGIARPCGQRVVDPAAGLPREWWLVCLGGVHGFGWAGRVVGVVEVPGWRVLVRGLARGFGWVGACGRLCGRGAGLACLGPWAGAGPSAGGGLRAIAGRSAGPSVSAGAVGWCALVGCVGWRGAFGGRGMRVIAWPRCRAAGSGGLARSPVWCGGAGRGGLARSRRWAVGWEPRSARPPAWCGGLARSGLVWRGGLARSRRWAVGRESRSARPRAWCGGLARLPVWCGGAGRAGA